MTQTTPAMTSRERWLAAIHLKPVDRLPFWPKLNASYPPAQEAPFRDMPIDALFEFTGSDPQRGLPGILREKRSRTEERVITEDGARRTLYRTPWGEMRQVLHFDEGSRSWHPVEFPVKTAEDIRRMTGFFEDADWELDADLLGRARAQRDALGESACLAHSVGKSPLMLWVEFLAGVEQAHLLLADHPEEVETLFEAIHRGMLAKARLLAEHSPADLLYMTENTSTTLISPDQYRRYCARHIGECGAVVRDAGRLYALHMCGTLKALLPQLAETPAHVFEAFTSPTLGDTTLLDGRTACPDKCLVGGTNAMLWTRSAPEIIRQIESDLDALPHHRGIIVTSAGVMPPLCKPETIREVCEWVKGYPVRV